MPILVTFPGKFGDLIWALPTIRALSRRVGEPVDLLVSHDVQSIASLVQAQPYIRGVLSTPAWVDTDCLPVERRMPPAGAVAKLQEVFGYSQVFHLGYRDWPKRGLPYETLDCLNEAASAIPWKYPADSTYSGLRWDPISDADLHLEEPWITEGWEHGYVWQRDETEIAVGFTDEHLELKFGLTELISQQQVEWTLTHIGNSPRWENEVGERGATWAESLTILRNVDAFLGCCSALHVLAVAAGVPVVLMEPSEARWNPIFTPLGTTGPQVMLVRGTDGRPTFDARHVIDALLTTLARRSSDERHRETQGH